jgi:hypothetical protein
MNNIKRLKPAFGDGYELDVLECGCGFHIGLDITYLDQVGEILMACPSCGSAIDTEIIKDEVTD